MTLPPAPTATPPGESTFSAPWLALREGADARARNGALAERMARLLSGHVRLKVTDLGSGTGANLRATAPLLGPDQHWTLIDHDPALLAEARRQLAGWADLAEEQGDGALLLTRGAQAIRVATRVADLAADPAAFGAGAPNLVTASAFFDLVSARWIQNFVEEVARLGAVFFTVLTCDGNDSWTPAHPHDAAIRHAFQVHQGRDKGFGPAAGAYATQCLEAAFAKAGHDSARAPSPWRLGPADAPLIAALAEGTAEAARDTGLVSRPAADAWRAARRGATCEIGHLDLLAWPRPRLGGGGGLSGG